MTDTFHLFDQIRKRVKKSDFKPNRDYIENAIQDFKSGGGVIKKVEFCMDEFDTDNLNSYRDNKKAPKP